MARSATKQWTRREGNANGSRYSRNLITRGLDLNQLIGQRSAIAGVGFEGLELCEPCQYLAKMVHGALLLDLVSPLSPARGDGTQWPSARVSPRHDSGFQPPGVATKPEPFLDAPYKRITQRYPHMWCTFGDRNRNDLRHLALHY